ncbi:MAG: TIGR04141 family sporadically distributed protein [Bacteroidales bacterium]|nr:TIGR04141 family sporadically distributed protein [Bacteroidales bacterium]
MSKNKLSILLIKKNTPANAIVKQQDGIQRELIAGYQFFYKNSYTSSPKWVESFFLNQLSCSNHLKTTSSAGVLIVERNYGDEHRFFAVCFGYGRNLITPTCIEERFGLIVALNSVNPKELRSLDISRLDSSSLKNRIQSAKLAGVADFEFDVEKSLLRQATGLSNDEEMGKNVSGSDSFTISVDTDIQSIAEVLDHCYTKYKSEDYKDAFSWIDHILPLKKGELITTLDELLIEKILDNREHDIWLAVPEIIDWDDISVLKYEKNGIEHEDILMNTFREEVIPNNITIRFLKNNYIHAYNANGEQRNKWSYYKCIYSEIEYDNKLYVLNAGSWYQIENDYKEQIENTYYNAPLSDIEVIDYNHSDESEYNSALAATSSTYHCMDRNLIQTGMAGNRIEFCDVYERSGKLIHVKKYGGSQIIGHLFNQGLVSARMLFDKDFRAEVNNRLPEDWHIQMNEFNPEEYEVIYGIISKRRDERPHIPFFSMVVFHDIYHTLEGFGYHVSLKAIYNSRP